MPREVGETRSGRGSLLSGEIRAEAGKAQIDLDPRSGARLAELVRPIHQTPPAVIAGAKEMLAKQGIQLQ